MGEGRGWDKVGKEEGRVGEGRWWDMVRKEKLEGEEKKEKKGLYELIVVLLSFFNHLFNLSRH